MKEKLIIKNFGPIKHIELELSRFTVLIGEQATGKSTVAKVLAVCRYFSYIIKLTNDPFETIFDEGLSEWGLYEAIKPDTYIYYECQHYSLTTLVNPIRKEETDQNDGKPFIDVVDVMTPAVEPKSKEFFNLIEQLNIIKPKPVSAFDKLFQSNYIEWVIPNSFFKNDVAAVMDNPFYIPTERGLQSIFSLGKSSIQNLSDSLFNQFASIDQIARLFKKDTIIEPLDILYKNVDGKGYIRKMNDDKFFSLFNAASGYQSTIPVILLVKYYSEIRKKKKTFIIEEPELNLFPIAQNKLMQFLVDKTLNYGNTILLTTHSPYILTSLNNLMYAYQVGETHKDKVNEVIEKKYWLNPADISAYELLSDGTCKTIIGEDGLIMAENIDVISRTLNKEFDLIQDIKLGLETANSF